MSEVPVPGVSPETNGIPLLSVVNPVLRHRRLVAGLAFAAGALMALITLLQPRTYTSSAIFMPQALKGQLSQLGGLAAQFGVAVPHEPTASPAFYASLLQSREILRGTLETSYNLPIDREVGKMTLVRWYDPPGETEAERIESGMLMLRRDMRVTTDAETGTVEARLRSRSPELARQVVQELVTRLSRFNLETRQSQAAAERKFTELQSKEAGERLQAAEERLEAFLQRNRDFRSSPQLAFENDRLTRVVSMRQELYTSLVHALEQARIDEVRDTPVLTIIDPPNLPARPDRRWLLVKAMLGVLAGALAGVFIALAREYTRAGSAVAGLEAEEFRALREEALHGVRRTAAVIGRALRRARPAGS
jgi:uncharacterized protein involved in exopolysaccharide biosynthesis